MRALAHIAEVSPATPYNFFGSKEGLLFALLTRHLQSFIDEALLKDSEDPIAQVLEAADKAVTILLRDPDFLRPLYQVMLGLTDPIHHPKFLRDAFVFYRSSLEGVIRKKLVANDHERDSLACSLMAHFMGVLDLWVHEDIDDIGFRCQLSYGFIHLLWPIARGKSLLLLKQRYAEVKIALSQKGSLPVFVKSNRS